MGGCVLGAPLPPLPPPPPPPPPPPSRMSNLSLSLLSQPFIPPFPFPLSQILMKVFFSMLFQSDGKGFFFSISRSGKFGVGRFFLFPQFFFQTWIHLPPFLVSMARPRKSGRSDLTNLLLRTRRKEEEKKGMFTFGLRFHFFFFHF